MIDCPAVPMGATYISWLTSAVFCFSIIDILKYAVRGTYVHVTRSAPLAYNKYL